MIGSALDLDSLSGEEDQVGGHAPDLDDDESRISTGAGSQVGLLKMSYTAAWIRTFFLVFITLRNKDSFYTKNPRETRFIFFREIISDWQKKEYKKYIEHF